MLQILKRLFEKKAVNPELSQKYKTVFKGKAGEEVYQDLLKFCKIDQPTYTPGDPTGTAFNEGLRRVGLRLLSMVESEDKKVDK